MRLRAVQLACLVLLLSSMSAARGITLCSGDFGLGGDYISRLLSHDHATAADEDLLGANLDNTLSVGIPAAAVSHVRIAWAMRPPALHSTAVHAFSGTEI